MSCFEKNTIAWETKNAITSAFTTVVMKEIEQSKDAGIRKHLADLAVKFLDCANSLYKNPAEENA